MYIYRHPKKERPIYASIISELEGTDNCDTEDLVVGTSFWNARGTSDDTIYYNHKNLSFINFWKEVTDQTLSSIDNKCANANCTNSNYKLEGAHIVFKEPTGDVRDGDEMCVVPLCPTCNNYRNTKEMKLRYDVEAPIIIWKEDE